VECSPSLCTDDLMVLEVASEDDYEELAKIDVDWEDFFPLRVIRSGSAEEESEWSIIEDQTEKE